jgi:uncharacterized protein YndB with AHSA1/START domain
MATESFEVSRIIPATPERIFNAWLDSGEHAKLTGMAATIDRTVGGSFTIGDGYIQGSNVELEPHRRIVQSWRTTEFPEGATPSRLEIYLEPAEGGTLVRLVHTELPEGQSERYLKGWGEYYFDPMTEYFSKSIGKDTSSEDVSDDEVTPGVDNPIGDLEPEGGEAESAASEELSDDEVTPGPVLEKKPARKAPAKKPAAKAKPKAAAKAKPKAAAKAKPKAAAKRKAAKPAAKAAKAKAKAKAPARKPAKSKKPTKRPIARGRR